MLWSPVSPPTPLQMKYVEDLKAGGALIVDRVGVCFASTPEEFAPAFSAVSRTQAQALYLQENPLYYVHRMTLAELATKARLPTIYASRTFADAGGLMSYGASYSDQMRRAAGYVDKILKGAKPGRSADRATDQVRAGGQSQDRQGPRDHDSAVDLVTGG